MAVLDRVRTPLLVGGAVVLCGVGVFFGLQEEPQYDSQCGQALWHGVLAQCDSVATYGWLTGVFLALGLACLALACPRPLVAAVAIAGGSLVALGAWRGVQPPEIGRWGQTCGSVFGLGPDDLGMDSPLNTRGDDCRRGLIDEGTVVLAFAAPGAVLLAGAATSRRLVRGPA